MQKNFDGIDIFFIIIISMYFIILAVIITIFVRKYLKEKQKQDNIDIMLEQTIKSDLLKQEIEKHLNPPKEKVVKKTTKKKTKKKKSTKKNTTKKNNVKKNIKKKR